MDGELNGEGRLDSLAQEKWSREVEETAYTVQPEKSDAS